MNSLQSKVLNVTSTKFKTFKRVYKRIPWWPQSKLEFHKQDKNTQTVKEMNDKLATLKWIQSMETK